MAEKPRIMINPNVKAGDQDMAALERAGERNARIVRTSVTAILANAALAGFKAVIGTVSGSIAIVLDAVNNLSDAASSVITIVGTRLASKQPDREHPYGHGRAEYLSALVIALIVLFAGVSSLRESIIRIIDPRKPEYSSVTLVIVAAAVLVKIFLGRHVKRVGKETKSDSLVNSGKDALLDSVISASTLLAAMIYIVTDVSLEAWLGAVISAVIIKSGIDMLKEGISEILGERADPLLAKWIKAVAMRFPEVRGVYDLILNNYGPDSYNGSFHIEVEDTLCAGEIDKLIRQISSAVYQECGVIITAISVYSINTVDKEVIDVRENIRRIVMTDKNILQMHGFFLDKEARVIRFDLVVSFNSPDRMATFAEAVEKVNREYQGYQIMAIMDTDYNETDSL